MQIIRCTSLTKEQENEIFSLTERCRLKGQTALSFPIEFGSVFFLLYDPTLTAVFSLSLPENEEEPAEGVAFTLPEKQRQGYFSALFDAAAEEIEHTDLLFPLDIPNEGAVKTLKALGAELDTVHYKMELPLSGFPGKSQMSPKNGRLTAAVQENDLDSVFSFALTENPLSLAGIARASHTNHTACLYDFELLPEFRGQGLGAEALFLFLSHMKKAGCKTVSLHVTEDNLSALKLYKKTGFCITESLSVYLY